MTSSMSGLENRVVIVTGGYRFIGKAICRSLADAGAKVYLTGRDERKLQDVVAEIGGEGIETVELDLRHSSSIEEGFEWIWQKEKKIDVLLNNAIYGKIATEHESADLEWFSIQTSPAFIEQLKRKNPLGRVGVPEDMVGIVVFLTSDASGFITG